jgi:hypothetical protein
MRRALVCRSLIGWLVSFSANSVQANESAEKAGSSEASGKTVEVETSKAARFPVIHIRESPYAPPSFGWTVGQPHDHVTEFINGRKVFSLGQLPDPPAYAETNAKEEAEMLLKSPKCYPRSTLNPLVLKDYLSGKPGYYWGVTDAETNF